MNSSADTSLRDRVTTLVGSVIAVAFFGLAAWFVMGSQFPGIPTSTPTLVAAEDIAPGPRREATGDPPRARIGTFSHTCNDCHQHFDTSPLGDRALFQHDGITLDHGMNSRCFNCHDEANRERLVLLDGSTVSYSQSPRLCASCHGTVYRDWERGTHGKTLGSWVSESPDQRRLLCTECHDPHSPAYSPLQPLPGPNTLRMGVQNVPHAPPDRHLPLRRWSGGHASEPAHADHEERR